MPIIYDPTVYVVPSFDDIVEEVLGNLQGYTLTQDQVTELTADVSPSDTALRIVMPEGSIGTGIVEVGDEQMYVASVDEVGGQLNLLRRGRGWRGTTAAAHAAGDLVVISPLVPRWRVKMAINDVITQVWPALYGVATYEFTWRPNIILAWGIPAEAEAVLEVRYKDLFGNWVRVRHWEMVTSMNTDSFPTGSALRITESLPGLPVVQVVYAKRPTGIAGGATAFTDSGLSPSSKDFVVYGAMARLVKHLDTGRLGVQSVSADDLDKTRPMGSAAALADQFQKSYEAALERERQALLNRYPARVHFQTAR